MFKRMLLPTIFMLSVNVHSVFGFVCDPGAVMYEFDDSDAVFIGKVIAVKEDGIIKMEIHRNFKGVEGKFIDIIPNDWESGMFKLKETYLVFAVGDPNLGYNVSDCSNTKRYSEAQKELGEIGALLFNE